MFFSIKHSTISIDKIFRYINSVILFNVNNNASSIVYSIKDGDEFDEFGINPLTGALSANRN